MTKWCTKKPWYYCSSIGVLMNTRGIVQLVVLNIGVELNVIPKVVFAIFVLMATILTFSTSPILYLLYRKDMDIRKLSRVNIVPDPQTVVVSNDQSDGNKEKETTVRWSRQSLENIHSSSVVLTIDERINYPEIDPTTHGIQPAVIGNIVDMPVCPKRSVNMTRF